MINFDSILKKTLFYNLIIFDFILLESSSKKISNFFIEKYKTNKFLFSRISLFPLLKNFKRFIRLLQFLKYISTKSFENLNIIKFFNRYQFINFFYFWMSSEHNLKLLNLLFKKYKLTCFLHLNTFSPFIKSKFVLKTSFIFDYFLHLRNFFSFFFKKFYLLHCFNSFQDSTRLTTFKIFSDFNDYKKLIFLSLIFISIFKK